MGIASLTEQAQGIEFPMSATQNQLIHAQDQEEVGDNLAPVPRTLCTFSGHSCATWAGDHTCMTIHFPFPRIVAANQSTFPQQFQKVLVHDEGMTVVIY